MPFLSRSLPLSFSFICIVHLHSKYLMHQVSTDQLFGQHIRLKCFIYPNHSTAPLRHAKIKWKLYYYLCSSEFEYQIYLHIYKYQCSHIFQTPSRIKRTIMHTHGHRFVRFLLLLLVSFKFCKSLFIILFFSIEQQLNTIFEGIQHSNRFVKCLVFLGIAMCILKLCGSIPSFNRFENMHKYIIEYEKCFNLLFSSYFLSKSMPFRKTHEKRFHIRHIV